MHLFTNGRKLVDGQRQGFVQEGAIATRRSSRVGLAQIRLPAGPLGSPVQANDRAQVSVNTGRAVEPAR